MANGRVCWDRHPMAASYAASAGTVTYLDPFIIARGVSVDISLTTSAILSFMPTTRHRRPSRQICLRHRDAHQRRPTPRNRRKSCAYCPRKTLSMSGSTTVKYQGYGEQGQLHRTSALALSSDSSRTARRASSVVLTKVRFSAPDTKQGDPGRGDELPDHDAHRHHGPGRRRRQKLEICL